MPDAHRCPECVICEKPCDGGYIENDDGEPVHADCLRMMLGHAESHKLYQCPYCGQDTPHPNGALWDKLLSSRVKCQECGREFMIEDDHTRPLAD